MMMASPWIWEEGGVKRVHSGKRTKAGIHGGVAIREATVAAAQITKDLLAEPTPRAARMVALALLDRMDAARVRLDDRSDVEALHDFRVALRRLRSWLRAYKGDLNDSVGKRSSRDLRGMARATNESRDLEAHLQWVAAQRGSLRPGMRGDVLRLERMLAAERRRADAAFRATLSASYAAVTARLRKNLSRYPMAVWDQQPGDRWALAAAERMGEAFLDLRSHLVAVEAVEDDDAAHQARIAAKRLRYLIEPLAGAVDGAEEAVDLLKQAQDHLGSLHDAHVFERTLRRHMRVGGAPEGPRREGGGGVQLLIERLRTRRDDAWTAFYDGWLAACLPRLAGTVHGIIRSLRDLGGAGIEIERKYLLRRVPAEVRTAPSAVVDQGYLPGKVLVERIRRSKESGAIRYTRTVKTGSGLARVEIEEACSEAVFDTLWPLTKGRRVRKRRYRVADAGRTWEVDVFLDRRLALAEVELASTRDVVKLPDWLADCVVREVTEEPGYANVNLAR